MALVSLSTLSPCVGICELDEEDVCVGCHRTSAEIAHWMTMTDQERLRLMETVLVDREARRTL